MKDEATADGKEDALGGVSVGEVMSEAVKKNEKKR